MLQYTDDSFSPNLTEDEALKQLFEHLPSRTVKALHFGTNEELKKIREGLSLKHDVEVLQAQVKALTFERLGFLHIPTAREVDKLNTEKLTL